MKLRSRAAALALMTAIALGLGTAGAQAAAPGAPVHANHGETLCASSLLLNVGICIPHL